MKTDNLTTWVNKLSEEQLPAFAHTARSLAFVSREEDSSADDLSNVILHDSAMTARILRIANSVHYNPTGGTIETVSYATVILGFEQVRNLALTISMIDTVLEAGAQNQVQKEMICAYHAAVQAQRLAKRSDPKNLEAVYIGALLHRLGPIMFWCFPFGYGDRLLQSYQVNESTRIAEKKVLGFSLDDLTSKLAKEWNLSDMLTKALHSEESKRHDERAVSIGLGIANNIHLGWDSSELTSKISSAADYLHISKTDAKDHIHEGAKIATEGLESFGFPQTHSLLPPEIESKKETDTEEMDSFELELRILRQLTQMLGDNIDLNRVLMAILEGIYRVSDMEQVVFAIVNRKTGCLEPKFMIGKCRDAIMNHPTKETTNGDQLDYVLSQGTPYWNQTNKNKFPSHAIDPLIRQLGAKDYFINPIMLQTKAIGVVYADRHNNPNPLSKSDFQSFCHLSDHASLAFKILSK